MPRTIFAFNGDLESRLGLDWLVALAVRLHSEDTPPALQRHQFTL